MAKKFNLNAILISKARQVSRYWPPANEALKEAKRGALYECALCKGRFERKDVQRDHISPVGGFKGDWNDFYTRLFCPKENYQIACQGCHLTKTKADLINLPEHFRKKAALRKQRHIKRKSRAPRQLPLNSPRRKHAA